MALVHGGQLARIAKQYQIPEQEWLDLSTGIAPFSYPIKVLPSKAWQELPTISESLIATAKQYYQAEYCWPLAGSQQLIEKLPQLWQQKQKIENNKHVYLPKAGYKEHQHAWLKAGYQAHFYQQHLPINIKKHAVVVVINPNNPRTDCFNINAIAELQQRCKQQQALLVIDEAFADIHKPEFSFVPQLKKLSLTCDDVIILRSIGKFFGLAGLRIGFVCSTEKWCQIIQCSIGPWSINGPALYLTEQALKDKNWQVAQLKRLKIQSKKQCDLLQRYLPSHAIASNALFITVFLENAAQVYQKFCQQAVYVRLTDENDALRFGIANERQLKRLEKQLMEIWA